MANSSFVMFAGNCLIASVEFTVLCPISLPKLFALGLNLSPLGMEIASSNVCKSDYKLASNFSGVGGSERGP